MTAQSGPRSASVKSIINGEHLFFVFNLTYKLFFYLEILASNRNRGIIPADLNSDNELEHQPGDFEELVMQHILQGDEDNEDNETVSLTLKWQNRKISELFDFNNLLWSSLYSNFASMSFNEELELYDLLELDAVGEEDQECGDIDLDGTTQDILGA